jgi:hypothetical protein
MRMILIGDGIVESADPPGSELDEIVAAGQSMMVLSS